MQKNIAPFARDADDRVDKSCIDIAFVFGEIALAVLLIEYAPLFVQDFRNSAPKNTNTNRLEAGMILLEKLPHDHAREWRAVIYPNDYHMTTICSRATFSAKRCCETSHMGTALPSGDEVLTDDSPFLFCKKRRGDRSL